VLCRRGTRGSLWQASLWTAFTEVHSAAACDAPAQSPSAALIGYDGTALFHHAAYAASYTARSATWQAMRPPGRIKDVQKLTGSLAALSCFISRLAERALPFFNLLRRSGPFSWTEEAEQAFQELKQRLTSLPVLVAPEPGETFLYLAASAETVSVVSRTPDSGARQPHLCLKIRTPDKGVRRSLVPVGTQNCWGPKDLTWWIGRAGPGHQGPDHPKSSLLRQRIPARGKDQVS